MTKNDTPGPRKPDFAIERILRASLDEVWEMWTTRDGLESWWGPDGFTSTVRSLDVRPGGHFEIEMEATAPGPKAMLEASGQPLINVSVFTFTEIVPTSRLAFVNHVDFIPDLEPYEVRCAVELRAITGGTRLTFRSNVMHDDRWTQLATAGWQSSLDRLVDALTKNR